MDIHFHGYKIKYNIINEKFLPVRAANNIKSLNIFINLDDFFHKLHTTHIDEEFRCGGKWSYKQMASNILNLIGHYKNWALKEGMRVSVYLIHSTYMSTFKNELLGLCDEYRKHYKEINDPVLDKYHHVNDIISNTLPLVDAIIKYIPNAYLVDTKYIEPSVAPLFLSTVRPTDWNFIVSRDLYDLQYCGLPFWSYISPKGDNSKVISGNSLWEYIYEREKIDSSKVLSSELFIYAKSILGDKYRNIPKLARVGWKTIIKYLHENIKDDDISTLFNIRLTEFLDKKKIDIDFFKNNNIASSIVYQRNRLLSTDESLLEMQLIDVSDIVSLTLLSKDIFSEFPLNIPFLTKTEPNANPQSNTYFWRS